MSKTILWKIVQRHSACFEPALSFYVVNIDVTDEKGKKKLSSAGMRAASIYYSYQAVVGQLSGCRQAVVKQFFVIFMS